MDGNYINYGMGVICFPNAIDIDQDLVIPYLSSLKQKAIEEDYTIVEENGVPAYAVNRSGHRYSIPDIQTSASHIMNFLDQNSPKELHLFFEKCENVMYNSLLKYIEMYPMILRNLWWRTLGHVLAYGPGSDMGLHNDNDVNYQVDLEPDLQLATRNVVGMIIYLNSSVEKKEDIVKYEYNNGEICFPYAKAKHTPKAGDVLIFPSNYLGTHEIKPCYNGSRYAYIGYFAQGSSHPERGIFITDEKLPPGKQGQIWMKNLRNDYINYILNKYNFKNIEEALSIPEVSDLLFGTTIRASSHGTKDVLPDKKITNEK